MDVRKQPSTQCCSDTDEETVKEEKQLIAFVVEPFGFLEVWRWHNMLSFASE